MSQFTSSAKILTCHEDNPATQKLASTFGNRLQKLNRYEKYQVCADLSRALEWYACPDDDLEDDESGFWEDCQFSNDNQGRVIEILQNESPETLANLLPVIAEYARDDNR